MNLTHSTAEMRPAARLVLARPVRCLRLPSRAYMYEYEHPSRAYYATDSTDSETVRVTASSTGAKRRSVTPFNDSGFVPWSELSAAEKAGRATQQTFNFGMVVAGLVLTGAVTYFLWTDVFSPESKISQFNRAVDKIKKDQRCIHLLGDPRKITAHGDETYNKWRRARPVSSSEKTDPQGNHHLIMHFYVEGPLANGMAQLHMVKWRGHDDYEYSYLFLDVPGHERIYLEKQESTGRNGKKQLSLFGVKW